MRACDSRSSPVWRPREAAGSRSKVSATSSMIARLMVSAPAAKPESKALSQRLLTRRGMPFEQRKTKSTAVSVKMSVRSAPATSRRDVT